MNTKNMDVGKIVVTHGNADVDVERIKQLTKAISVQKIECFDIPTTDEEQAANLLYNILGDAFQLLDRASSDMVQIYSVSGEVSSILLNLANLSVIGCLDLDHETFKKLGRNVVYYKNVSDVRRNANFIKHLHQQNVAQVYKVSANAEDVQSIHKFDDAISQLVSEYGQEMLSTCEEVIRTSLRNAW
jgi:hypothetical protein